MSAIKRLVILTLMFSLYGLEAAAASKTVGDWKIVTNKFEGSSYCYAYTTPYRTKSFDEQRENPYLILVTKEKSAVSIGLNSGFVIDAKQGITLSVNKEEHLLDAKLNKNAWTYSSTQDVAIINDMLADAISVEVRSYNMEGKTAVDYYSLKGILHTVNYLQTNCQGIQTASK